MHASLLSSIQSAVLIATLIAVIFYMIETAKLRKEAQKQNELSLRPFLMLSPSSSNEVDIINIGHSPAFNIRLDFIDFGGGPALTDTICFNKSYLSPGEAIRVLLTLRVIKIGDKEYSLGINTKNILLNINYENINKRGFYTKVKFNLLTRTEEFLDTNKISEGIGGPMESNGFKQRIAREYILFLGLIVIGLLLMPFLRSILLSSELGVSGAWKSLRNLEFLFKTNMGLLSGWHLISFPYAAFLFIRSVLWARKQMKTAKPPV